MPENRGISRQPPFDIHLDDLVRFRPVRLRILFVVEGNAIKYTPAQGFGISKVLDTLRNLPSTYFYVRFDISIADRDGATAAVNPKPGPYDARFTRFRFTMPGFKINDYDQIWFFGFRPGNGSDLVQDGTELSAEELKVLSAWMDNNNSKVGVVQGGVFATGDHEDLGATLCSNIPRVRTMRRWVNAQGVPPIAGANRHDTNVPATSSQQSGLAQMPDSNQGDGVAMKIHPRLYSLGGWSPFSFSHRPHPILCGLDGIIDILPDHPHEGAVFEDHEVDTSNPAEYPSLAGVRPLPQAIAHADVLGQPPLKYQKGAVHPKRFPCIGAYDGQQANVGRVVVDSTWHHWMNMNLVDLEANNPADYARIQNYFRNVALWLATARQRSAMLRQTLWSSMFIYPGLEEYSVRSPTLRLGRTARDVLGRLAPDCTVTEWVLDNIFRHRRLELLKPLPEPRLIDPPFELVEDFLLGGMLKELLPLGAAVQAKHAKVTEKDVASAMERGVRRGQQELMAFYKESLERGRERLKLLEDAVDHQALQALFSEDAIAT